MATRVEIKMPALAGIFLFAGFVIFRFYTVMDLPFAILSPTA
jgi:hypothetical protein